MGTDCPLRTHLHRGCFYDNFYWKGCVCMLNIVLLEPEIPCHGETKGTLVAQGMITPENGVYPIYRYIHDLNEHGFIDYQ